jgi:hypothetical protein
MFSVSTACVIASVLVVGVLSAQEAKPGQQLPIRIRLTPSDTAQKPLIGTPVSIGPGVVRLVPDGKRDTLSVATTSILRLEESRGRRSNLGRGAVRGAMAGVLVGVISGAASGGSSDHCSSNCSTTGDAVATGAVFVGMLGLAVGSVVGLLSSHEQWTAMPMVALDRTHGAGRVSLAVRIRFPDTSRRIRSRQSN